MKIFRNEAFQVLGAPLLVLTAYGLDSWRLSPDVLRFREIGQPTAASVLGTVFPQTILIAVALLLGWYVLVRSRPSVWVSLFYGIAGAYFISYLPMLALAHSNRMIREFCEVFYYPCMRYFVLLPLQTLLQISFAVLFVLGLFGTFRCLTSRPIRNA